MRLLVTSANVCRRQNTVLVFLFLHLRIYRQTFIKIWWFRETRVKTLFHDSRGRHSPRMLEQIPGNETFGSHWQCESLTTCDVNRYSNSSRIILSMLFLVNCKYFIYFNWHHWQVSELCRIMVQNDFLTASQDYSSSKIFIIILNSISSILFKPTPHKCLGCRNISFHWSGDRKSV